MAFKDHFSGHAPAYADARPGYPASLFDWLSGQCRGHEMALDDQQSSRLVQWPLLVLAGRNRAS